MSKLIAISNLKVGRADGETFIEAGQEVPKDLLTDDEVKALTSSGAIGTPAEAVASGTVGGEEVISALEAKIAELTAQLEASQASTPPSEPAAGAEASPKAPAGK